MVSALAKPNRCPRTGSRSNRSTSSTCRPSIVNSSEGGTLIPARWARSSAAFSHGITSHSSPRELGDLQASAAIDHRNLRTAAAQGAARRHQFGEISGTLLVSAQPVSRGG